MQIDDCVRSPTKDLPLTKFKLFGEQDSAPLLAESTDGINFTVRTGPCQLRHFDSFDPPLLRVAMAEPARSLDPKRPV